VVEVATSGASATFHAVVDSGGPFTVIPGAHQVDTAAAANFGLDQVSHDISPPKLNRHSRCGVQVWAEGISPPNLARAIWGTFVVSGDDSPSRGTTERPP
jgi:hypothetical protein